jgi:type III secretory pathway lipoprotein EscJ
MVNQSLRQISPRLGGRSSTLFVILGLTLLLGGCGAKPIVTVKNEAEAIKIIDVLREYDIPAKKEEVTESNVRAFKISVESEEAGAAAFQILNAHCLPQTEPPAVESATISSPDVERAKIQRQQKMSIVTQLRSLPGATCVDVNYSLSQNPLDAVYPYPARAAVILNHKTPEVPYNEAEVREIVSGTIPNLKSENVTVKFIYQPIPPPEKAKSGGLTRLLLIGGVGLAVILGSAFLVYFLRTRNQNGSSALAERAEEVETAETVQ